MLSTQGYVLSAYLDQTLGPHYLVNKRVLELGAGTGLVGIVAALLGRLNFTSLRSREDAMNNSFYRGSRCTHRLGRPHRADGGERES